MHDLKGIYKHTFGIRRYFILSLLFVAIETFFEVIIPLLMADLIDQGVLQHKADIFVGIGVKMGICALLSLLFGFLYARVAAIFSSRLAENLRNHEYDTIQKYSFSNLDHFETSSLITRITGDVMVIQNSITSGIRPFVRGPVMLILGLVMSFLINAQVAIIFFFVLPILAIILFCIVRKVAPMYKVLQKSVDQLNLIVQETLQSIRVIKAFVRETYEEERFQHVNQSLMDVSWKTFHYALFNQPAFQLTMYMAIVALIYVGSQMILSNVMQVGELTGILSYVLQIMNSLMMISNVFLLMVRSMASVHRINEVFEETIDMEINNSDIKIHSGDIDFQHVYFKYNIEASEYVLEDITWHIQAGQTVGIVGGCGSGKSSLISLIPRLYDVTQGTLFIDGKNVKDLDLVKLRDDVSVVLQNNLLFSGTILENLRWGNPNACLEEIQEACSISCVDEFIDQLPDGLNTLLSQGGVNVSGGQKQRLCIARALLKKPKILIFDDSTSALDTITDSKIKTRLKKIEGLTQIIISQRISSVSHCDQILVLDNGRIEANGTHEELLKISPIYKGMFESQKKGDEYHDAA